MEHWLDNDDVMMVVILPILLNLGLKDKKKKKGMNILYELLMNFVH